MSFGLRYFVPKSHRIGMKMVNQQNFLEAVNHFENSYQFFKRNYWIDKYRFITLLSSSKISYQEMALNNIAFCYAQAGNGIKSKEFYEKTLIEFPNSGIAKAGLNIINAGENNKKGL
jgi:tetratricopeptide (TPR) repeat protein